MMSHETPFSKWTCSLWLSIMFIWWQLFCIYYTFGLSCFVDRFGASYRLPAEREKDGECLYSCLDIAYFILEPTGYCSLHHDADLSNLWTKMIGALYSCLFNHHLQITLWAFKHHCNHMLVDNVSFKTSDIVLIPKTQDIINIIIWDYILLISEIYRYSLRL